MRTILIVMLLAAWTVEAPLSAQAPAAVTPSFEVASIKRNTNDDFALRPPRFEGETFTAGQAPVAMLISTAYGVPQREIVDGPSWIFAEGGAIDRFDIVAKAVPGSSRQDMQAMLRRLLEERFALRVRRERREMPVYLLTRVDPNQLGPNLRPVPAKPCPPKTVCGTATRGRAMGMAMPWAMVLQNITNGVTDRRVLDRTGLSGTFDFEFSYRQGLSADPNDPQADIFTSVRQQFGLKLESAREPFDVIAIERVERPTPD